MPYITQKERNSLAYFDHACPETVGQLNYLITRLCNRYLNYKKESYQTYNDILGVLEAAKHELYRRKIAEYENKKIEENGEIEV